MIWINLIILSINLSILVIGYQLVKKRIEKKVINKEILADIKKEMNSLVMNLNETTLSNVTLIEEKVETLKKIIQLADKKIHGLDEQFNANKKSSNMLALEKPANMNTYTIEKVVNQSRKVTEIKNKEIQEKVEKNNVLIEAIKDFSTNEKIKYLNEKGLTAEEIRKLVKMDKGEFELLLNLENIQLD